MSNMRNPKRNEMVGAYIPQATKKLVRERAKKMGLTVADYVRWLIDQDTEEEDKKTQPKDK